MNQVAAGDMMVSLGADELGEQAAFNETARSMIQRGADRERSVS
jgi:hypothetical protein